MSFLVLKKLLFILPDALSIVTSANPPWCSFTICCTISLLQRCSLVNACSVVTASPLYARLHFFTDSKPQSLKAQVPCVYWMEA